MWEQLVAGRGTADERTQIATRFASRARANLRRVHAALLRAGYEFARPDAALREADENAAEQLDDFAAQHGRMPTALRVWYEHIESVDFRQSNTQALDDASPMARLGADAFVVQALEHVVEDEHFDDAPPVFFPLGGSASTCDPIGLTIPSDAFDTIVVPDTSATFGDYVRSSLASGGLPRLGLAVHGASRLPSTVSPRHPRPAELLASLVEGLEAL